MNGNVSRQAEILWNSLNKESWDCNTKGSYYREIFMDLISTASEIDANNELIDSDLS